MFTYGIYCNGMTVTKGQEDPEKCSVIVITDNEKEQSIKQCPNEKVENSAYCKRHESQIEE